MENNLVKVLDHGFLRLVDHMGSDLAVVRAARVSFDADWRAGNSEKSDERLLRYLLNNNHVSPFESVTFTFEVKCPIFVARQWHRHWSWRFNEVSARYTELPEEFYLPQDSKITTQSKDNKQARTDEQHPQAHDISYHIMSSCKKSFANYKFLLELGCPRELARSVLPVATYIRFFATANLRSVLNFLDLRDHNHAQYESRVYAQAMKKLIVPIVPVIMGIKYGNKQS